MRSNDVPCAACGYNLRGVRGTVCPECGGLFDPIELSAPAREVPLPEFLGWPVVAHVVGGVNLALYAIMRFVPPPMGMTKLWMYWGFLAVLFVVWAVWDGLSMDEEDVAKSPSVRHSLLGMIVGFAGLGLSRLKGAEVWAPLAALAMTGLHVLLVIAMWMG